MADSQSNSHRATQQREQNFNWRGGRSVASNGYVLVRVGVGHHLSDVRGYAYEHRVVAEQKIGRRLLPGEQVHHINGDKLDNRPDNLEVMESLAHHFVLHRKPGSNLRLPGEANPQTRCACGCGKKFPKYDHSGRPRVFVSGHNPHSAPSRQAVLDALRCGAFTARQLSSKTGLPRTSVSTVLSRLNNTGMVYRTGRVWSITH